jgi:hypothetical protein
MFAVHANVETKMNNRNPINAPAKGLGKPNNFGSEVISSLS